MQIPLLTTRFNNDTWQENYDYRERNGIKGCIYGSATQIKCSIPINALVFIIEMNNSTNHIEGVSLVRNFAHFDKYYKIYSSGTYNRYTYKSEYRIESIHLDSKMVEILENICFKGKSHLKRGIGFTAIPEKLKRNAELTGINIEKSIKEEFHKRFEKFEISKVFEVFDDFQDNRSNISNKKKKKNKLVIID
jgi:hypothetical protein